ncbi:hypothetical protein A1O7_06446 [Cladophialophora yegresii CBS 114405]|uniref:Uncharacterized protein n=1 Tax=Cladophialophora yegresii CBS 114405 TaxID=1182544 RepID=W9W201_9EURO|nr:uncharacterized protein A1O7_06446 [Cladophialophora yegresii CBS 114405]EXJ59015.1 hypothetical protein A1O7_06446 [Cladophialophora yegresii CBS 114405]
MLQALVPLSAGLLTLVAPALARPELPYNPTRIVPAQNGSIVYIFSPQPSATHQFALSWLNTSETVNSSSPRTAPFETLPFLSESEPRAFLTLPPDDEGFSVLVGDCNDPTQDLELWRFMFDTNFRSGVWSTPALDTDDESLSLNYLSAGFTFSPTNSLDNVSLYIFGGMCPDNKSPDASSWISDAAYSNTMLTFAQGHITNDDRPYTVSLTGARAPPVAEAGLTITPLVPTSSNTSENTVSQQQNFALIGGHTQNAFINMSQLAIFSLPQESWAFVDVTQGKHTVEPRSGHTAILTDDGSKIVVFGGWVGDINTPAQPQLAVLNIAREYGGEGDWAWTAPSLKSSPLDADQGIYGHAATMLSGGVMMVTGGQSIAPSGYQKRRDLSHNISFLNTTSFEWTDVYTNPHFAGSSSNPTSAAPSTSGLKTSEKAGIGAGVGLGVAAAAVVAIVWLLYSRKLRAKRALREKELRELALGAERYHSPLPPGADDPGYSSMRSASWAAAQEATIGSAKNPFPWIPVVMASHNDQQRPTTADSKINSARHAERTGVQMELPSPTRGLRKGVNTRGPPIYHPFNQHPPTGPGAVFRIEEEDERSHSGSLKRAKTPRAATDNWSIGSNPFKDPPAIPEDAPRDEAAVQRKKEVEEWVDDWQSAAESMTVSRSPSKAHSRTYSNLSQSRNAPASREVGGRGSPEKSDRTGSNISEKSMTSIASFQRSVAGTLSRNVSQRSASAGHALFSSPAAAMGRFGFGRQGAAAHDGEAGLSRAPSNRSVSLNFDTTRDISAWDGPDTLAAARSRWAPSAAGEDQSLLNRGDQPRQSEERDYNTLQGSPSKDKYSRAGSLTNTSRRALNLLGSVRRVFTGTGGVDVQDRVAAFESGSGQPSPTKHSQPPEMTETSPQRKLSGGATSFWRSKQGAKDWEDDLPGSSHTGPSSTVRRKPVPGLILDDGDGEPLKDDDWDVETAVQQRLVQVMFTVPKEKLRVVNVDSLSLLSSNRSEVDQDEDKERDQVKRMSSVREGDEDYHDDHADDDTVKGKGKARAL